MKPRGNQKESTTQPALLKVCQNGEKNHSMEELDMSEIQEELKKANSLPSLSPAVRTADKDKQPQEGFFHFLGNLFNIATKSSLVESKPASTFKDECNRCEKDLQNRNTFLVDMQPKHPKIEEPLCSTSKIKDDSIKEGNDILNSTGKEVSQDLQGGQKPSADAQKQMQRKPEAPAVTYATYRGSARIRQLLKNQLEIAEKGEENTENRNAAMVKENGEIQIPVCPKSGYLITENGENESKAHDDDDTLNSSAVKIGRKKSDKSWHFLDSSKCEITVKSTTAATESSHSGNLKPMPVLATTNVRRTHSLDSLLSSSSRNSNIPSNSTSQITNSLKMNSANDLVGKDAALLGEAKCPFQADKNATHDFVKENDSKTANKESTKEIQADCLHSPISKSRTINDELQVSKGEFCYAHQMESNSEMSANVHMLQSNPTALQQQVNQHQSSANEDRDVQKIVAAVGEENPQTFLAAILSPFNKQIPTLLGMECEGGKCIATDNQTVPVSSLNEDVVMDTGTCNEEPSVLGEPTYVQNDNQSSHAENSKGTAIQQTNIPSLETEGLETIEFSSEVALENLETASSCIHGCESLKSSFDEPTAALAVTYESSETGSSCSASLHSGFKFRNKTTGKREVSLLDMRETLPSPDLEYEKSKSSRPPEVSLSENSIPVHNHHPVSLETISESQPVSEVNCINFFSAKENTNKSRISPIVLDSSSDNKEDGQMAGWSAASEQESFFFAAFESSAIIPEDRMTKVQLCTGDPSISCPATSLESELTPAMFDSSVTEVDAGGVPIHSSTSPTLEFREASNLSIGASEMFGLAQGSHNSSSHTVSGGAEEAYSGQQADNSVLAEAMPPPICPLKFLEMPSKAACTVRMCKNAVGQAILGIGASAISETPVVDDEMTAASTKSNELCSEELWNDTNVKAPEHAKLQDAAGLFKKAEEIVDSVLHLAVEEIIAECTVDVSHLCGSKDSLTSIDIQNDQKVETVPLEAKEVQSAEQSSKHLNENSGGGSSSLTGKLTVNASNQDENVLSYTPDDIDLHSVLALKAKETIEEIIHSAKQKLASHQWQGSERKRPSEKIEPQPKAETPKFLNLDMKLLAKTQEAAEKEETQNVTVNCDKTDCSGPPLLLNSRENGMDWPQQGEKIPNSLFDCQTNGFLPTGSSSRPESDPVTWAKEKQSRKVCDHLPAVDLCAKDGLAAPSRKANGSSHLVQKVATVTAELILSLHSKCSCSTTATTERTLLPTGNLSFSSFLPNEESLVMQIESKDKINPWVSLESNAEDSPYKHGGKEAAELPAQVKATFQDSEAIESKEELAEGASEIADVNIGLNAQLIVPELSVVGEGSEGKNCLNTDLDQTNENLKQVQIKGQDTKKSNQLEEIGLDFGGDMKESTAALNFSPLIEQWENSSFTTIYEGTLQTENRSVSTDDVQIGLLSSSDLPSDNINHLMCERAKNKAEPVGLYGLGNKLNEATDSHSSESFLSVEAKRYRVYPFSLSPIYEDDSSQEDILSTDVSPEGCPSGKPKDNPDHASVLSLLQSVSERLQFTTQFGKEEDRGLENADEEESSYEENILDTERENDCLFSQLSGNAKTTLHCDDQNRSLFLEQSLFHSKDPPDCKKQQELCPDAASPRQTACKPVSRKADAALKQPPASAYYQYLKSASSRPSEKGTRFGSILQDLLRPKIHWSQDNTVPKLGELSKNLIDRASLKYNPRPGKMIIYDLCGDKSKREVHSDVLDTTSWSFRIGTVLRIIRGCWILYEKPKFQGRKYVLEEGEAVLDHLWDLLGMKHHRRNLRVGSIKHVTKDCGVPEVEFCLAAGGTEQLPICIQNAVANLEDLDVEKNPYIRVKSGVWLAYSDFNYKGDIKVLEDCDLPSEIPSADVKSLHPLKMGGLKVQMPLNVKIIIYEKSHFEGWAKEFSENVSSIPALLGGEEDFQGIGSLRVVGGVWVAYDKKSYKGRQYLLEEGDYEDKPSWGGTDSDLLSFRFLQADFIESSVALFQSDDEDGKALDIINEEIPDLEQTGFGPETSSILVRSGVWVAYQQKHFCGEQYILEKGKYKCFFDWGGSSKIIMSIRPIKLEPLGMNEPPHLLRAFSNTHFQGACIDFTTEVSDFPSFIPCSFKVLRGCWLLYYQGEITDNHCVLEEGFYVNLSSCGCPAATIKSLKPIQYVFAEPSISLFALECCKGRELHFSEPVNSVLNEDLHFYTQSVWVRSGLWIAYEGCNFSGNQILLEPSEVSNWNEQSGWKAVGSLRPVKQPAVYLRVKNQAEGKYLTVAGSPADAKATAVCASPYNGKNTQIWHYCRGLFKSKANNACLDVIGGRDVPGAKVALWAEHGKDRQKWRLNENGTISSYLSDQLVLDIKGGNYYDKNHIIMNQQIENKHSQKWEIEIL